MSDGFEGIAGNARKELDKQATLLAGLEADLDIISRVKIHVEFMSPAVRNAIEAGEKPRTLGDYVSNVKMKQVAETCARTNGEAFRVHDIMFVWPYMYFRGSPDPIC
jgi:autophagy-related protein 11